MGPFAPRPWPYPPLHNNETVRGGKRVASVPTLAQIRERAKRDLARLPEPLRRLEAGAAYPVEISAKLKTLAAEMDAKAVRR
jgi:nicotinate phosphoribosyltransferase